jgi:hypothetical protein
MKNYTLLLFLLPLIHSCNGQNKTDRNDKGSDTTLTLLTYGLPNFEKQNSNNVIAKKWGIRFYAVAGCVVTEELEDSVKINNDKINKLIENKYGANWRDKFENEVDEEFKREKVVSAVLDKIDFIKKKDEQMNLEGNGLHYYMTPQGNIGNYNVSAEGWGTIDKKDVWVSYYRLTVNYKTKKYKLLDDKIKKRE